MRFQDIASRITGVSIPIFGVSWNPPESEREVVRHAFVFLEDRRALYNDYAHEIEREVTDSVQAIRSELTSAIRRLPEKSPAADAFRSMRVACREYLDLAPPRAFGPFGHMVHLGRLRTVIGTHVAYLAVRYGIDPTDELERIIPPDLQSDGAKRAEA